MFSSFLTTLLLMIADLLTTPNVLVVQNPIIQLPNGLIRGRQDVTIKNKTFYAFEGIPYATPPIAELRFQAPIPPKNWDGILDTFHLNVVCFQEPSDNDYESEDCLYINVFTPQLPSLRSSNEKLAVMVFIHGGGFVEGTSLGVMSHRLIEKDVIFVTLNYRLGPFGFISTQDGIIPGNSGLKDQHLAIKWTHDNIHLFGGDPEKITIFGQSAGSASCSYHLLNQKSKGLFRGAILESGSFLSPWAYQRRAREIAFKTASFLNESFATNNDSKALLSYLQSVDARALDGASLKYHNFEFGPQDIEILQGFYWAPVVEVNSPDAFLTEKMFGLLSEGKVVAVPILIGMTSEEGISFNQDPVKLYSDLEEFDQNLSWLVPNDMQQTDYAIRTELGRSIRDLYTKGQHNLSEHLGDGIRYYSDNSFTRSIIKQAELYSQFADTYFYQFSYHGELAGNHIIYDGADSAWHGEEYLYIFCRDAKCDISGFPALDQLISEQVITIWTNFAKFLNPTPEPSEVLQNITWPVLSVEKGDFFYVNINETLKIENRPKNETYRKWVELYDSLGPVDFDTY